MSGATARRRLAKIAPVIVIAAAPATILAWMGCSSSSSSGAGVVRADPGGTYGADVHVTVIGRGRVVSDIKGVDCPDPFNAGTCFASYTFSSSTDDGAAGGVKLTAKVVEGSTFKFSGWKFDTTTPIGSKGRGPDQCNPLARPGVSPSVDMSAADITLPFGRASGTPPAGQEAACATFTNVPVAYNVTATFIDTDAGVDAGPPDLLYNSAGAGAAREIAVYSGRLYWRFQSGASHGIATALTSVPTGSPPGTPQILVSPTQPIPVFHVDSNIVYQTSLGTVTYLTPGSTSPQPLSGAGTCAGVASDSNDIYCRTTTGLLQQWSTFGSTTPNVWYSGLPVGTGSNELAADTSSGSFSYLYLIEDNGIAGSAAIRRVPKASGTFDGGVPTEQDVVTARPGAPSAIATYFTSRLFWLESDTLGGGIGFEASQTTSAFATALTSTIQNLKILVQDSSSSSFLYMGTTGTSGQILRTSSTSSSFVANCRSNINGLGGIAVDSQYIYWTQADGGVYRTLKSNCM